MRDNHARITLAEKAGIGLLAVTNVVIHLAFYNTLGFHRDELLYFSLGQHLSAGYASIPPLTGFISWLMLHLAGPTLFAARLVPALFSGLFIIVGAAIARELKGGSFARLLTCTGILITPFNLRAFYMLQPVYMDVFLWGLVILLVLRWINTGKDKYIIFTGIVFGIGMMNKYLIALEIFCVFLVLLFTSHRVFLKRRAFYYSILIAFLILLPNMIWQVKHNFPVVTHMHALHDSQLVHVNRVSFFTDQLFIGAFAVFLVIPGIVHFLSKREKGLYRPLMVSSLLVVIILALLRGKSYYTIGLFSFWIAAGAVFWEGIARSVLSRSLLILILILFLIPLFPMGIPVFKPDKLANYFASVKEHTGFDAVLRWETGRIHPLPQDYADMLGWDELAEKTAKAYKEIMDKRGVMIYAENYGEAGSIMVLGKKYGLPEPTCFCESFFYWAPRKLDHEVNTLIYINSEMGEDIKSLFSEIRISGEIENPLAREHGTTIWVCRNPVSSFTDFWEWRVGQVKSPF